MQNIQKMIESSHLLVFDFDGVSADSVEEKTKAFASIYGSYGEEIKNKVVQYHRNHGTSVKVNVNFVGVGKEMAKVFRQLDDSGSIKQYCIQDFNTLLAFDDWGIH